MSEANRTNNTNTSSTHTEDPLAELARIVSGDVATDDTHDQLDSNTQTSNDDFGLDLESELLRELDGTQPEPATSDEAQLAQALDSHSNTQVKSSLSAPMPQEQSFEDQLLNELELGQDPLDQNDLEQEIFEQDQTAEPEIITSAPTSQIDAQMQADLQAAEDIITSESVPVAEVTAQPSEPIDPLPMAIEPEPPELTLPETPIQTIEEPVATLATPSTEPVAAQLNADMQDTSSQISDGVNSELDDIFAQGFADELAVEELAPETVNQDQLDQQQISDSQVSTPQVEDLGAIFAQSISQADHNSSENMALETAMDDQQLQSESFVDSLVTGTEQQFEDTILQEQNIDTSLQYDQPLQPELGSSNFQAEHQSGNQYEPISNAGMEHDIGQEFETGLAQAAVQPSTHNLDAAFADPGSLDVEDIEKPNAPIANASNSGGGMKLALGALGIALIAGLGIVGWGAMSGDTTTNDADVPVISAEQTPTKVKPQDPGGKQIANTENKVYENVASNGKVETTQEKLINSRQDPTPLAENDANSAEQKNISRLQPGSNSAIKNNLGGVSPKRVRTLTIKPDGSIVRSSAPKPADNELAIAKPVVPIAVTQPQVTTPPKPAETNVIKPIATKSPVKVATKKPTVAQINRTATAKVASQKSTARAPTNLTNIRSSNTGATNLNNKTTSSGPTRIAALPRTNTPANVATTIPAGTYTVQVSSQRSDSAAKASYANIKKRFSSVLKNRQAVIQKATIAGKGTFYRAKIPASSKAAANKLCASLKRAGGSCFVSR